MLTNNRTLLLLALLLTAPVPAQDPAAFASDLAFLTSESAEGRGVGTDGDRLVTSYLARRMRDLGLAPWRGGSCDGYLQPFTVRDPRPRTFASDRTRLRFVDGELRQDLEIGGDALPFAGSADGTASGKLVFAGYGLRIDALGHDDYEDLDVRGKVVLVLRGVPGWDDRASRYREHTRAMLFATKMAHAREAGAAGFLLCNRNPPGGPEAVDAELGAALRARGDAGIPAFWITRRAAELLMDGCGGGLSALQGRIERGDLARCETGVEIHMGVEMGPPLPDLETANVLGVLRGVDPERARELVVVAAHHDHLGRGGFGSLGGPSAVGQVHPGADDNASGVAGLLQAAELLAGQDLRRTVLFAAFGAEELGMQGSRWFLEESGVDASDIVAMLNMDMIGRAGGGLRIEGTGSGKGWDDLLTQLSAHSAVDVTMRQDSSRRSDHSRFLGRRVPALLFHTGLHGQYHRPSDVASLVQVEEAVAVAELLAEVARELAMRPDRVEFQGRLRDR